MAILFQLLVVDFSMRFEKGGLPPVRKTVEIRAFL